jgi:hypothetical protein
MNQSELADIEHRYRELKNQLQDLGFVIAGSVAERRTTCGAATCRCRTDPTHRHGPYFEYTRKVAGKTTGRRLTAEQAQQYRAWIANRRTLEQITAAMDELSHQAAHLLLAHHPHRDDGPSQPAVTENHPAATRPTDTDIVTRLDGLDTCPVHQGCSRRRCAHWDCSNIIHIGLNRRGQPRQFCSTRCRVAEHRRLN